MKPPKWLCGSRLRRVLMAANLFLFLVGVVTIAMVIGYFAERAPLRHRFDATKTRAYSLSEATQQLLAQLPGDWTIAMVMVQDSIDPQLWRQIDEVLERFGEATPNLKVVRADPTDPQSLREFERLLADLQVLYRELVLEYDGALDAGTAAFAELQAFAQVETGRLQRLLQVVPLDDPGRRALEQRVAILSLLAQEGGQVLEAIEEARRTDQGQPIPDYETARSILVAALAQWSNELLAMAREFRRWADDVDADPSVRTFATEARRDYQAQAQRLVVAADPLKTLDPLELSTIGQQLRSEQAAVIIGPDRAAAIASAQLFPKFNLREGQDGGISYDQRFRGEQQIAATIRAMLVDQLPTVIVVHGEDGSLLRPGQQQMDLVGLRRALKVAQFGCEEWIVSKAERPTFPDDQPVVWLVQPPTPGAALQPTEQERSLVSAARELVADGEPVLLSCYPTLLHRYGQRDPWAELLAEFGLHIDTSRVIYESVRVSDAQQSVVRGQAMHELASPHPIAQAVNGQQVYFGLPVPIEALDGGETPLGGRNIIATIDAAPDRWLEEDWLRALEPGAQPDQSQRLIEDQPVVVSAERPHPLDNGTQRVVVVGSGGWLLSNVADVMLDDSAGRTTLVNPGNYEMALASFAWLTGQDALIASNPTGQQVARLAGVTDKVRWRWFWMTTVAVPVGCLLLSMMVWSVRRI